MVISYFPITRSGRYSAATAVATALTQPEAAQSASEQDGWWTRRWSGPPRLKSAIIHPASDAWLCGSYSYNPVAKSGAFYRDILPPSLLHPRFTVQQVMGPCDLQYGTPASVECWCGRACCSCGGCGGAATTPQENQQKAAGCCPATRILEQSQVFVLERAQSVSVRAMCVLRLWRPAGGTRYSGRDCKCARRFGTAACGRPILSRRVGFVDGTLIQLPGIRKPGRGYRLLQPQEGSNGMIFSQQ